MQHANKVVVVVFDGLRPDMVTPEMMPHLHQFAATNTWFREARSVFPSMTRVATSSIAAGAPPAVHGIVGNSFYYPGVTHDHALDTGLASDIAMAEAALNGEFLTAPTFADALAAKGKSFAVVHTGSAGSAYCINPRVARNGQWTFSIMGADHTRTPDAVHEMVERFGPLPARTLPRFDEIDYAATVLTDYVLAELNPDVALIWFNEPDTSYHYKFLGTRDTLAVMARADEAFGRIVAAIAERADANDVAIIVASDHGQITSTGEIDMARLLTEAGHPAGKAATRKLDGAALAITGGNMGEIRVINGDLERRDAVARWLMQQDFTGMVFTSSDDPVQGSVAGTFSLNLVGMDHARAPHLMYILRSDKTPDIYGLPGSGLITGGVPVGGGMHGGLNAHELNTVLVLGGAASRSPAQLTSAPAGIVDIAPTVLDLLGLAALPTMRGSSLMFGGASHAQPKYETFVASTGQFRQEFTVARRDRHIFPIHGQRVTQAA
jgi:phosphonoacetate hydrolase